MAKLFKAAIITENDHDGDTPPEDFSGRMLQCDVENGITDAQPWRKIRRFAAKGFVIGEVGSEKMERLERLAKHGPQPRLPTEEEAEALDVPDSFQDVAPPHNERVRLMREKGYDPYEVSSHPTKEQTLAIFWVFESGDEVLEELDLKEKPLGDEEASKDEVSTDEVNDSGEEDSPEPSDDSEVGESTDTEVADDEESADSGDGGKNGSEEDTKGEE